MSCAACGHANPERAKFCLECGTPLAVRCPHCGTELPPAAKFCFECGARTAAAPPPSPPPAVRDAGARKVVTILFADLAGSTGLQERLDAESTGAFMARYYAAMRAVIAAHGGTVVKLLGDGVMAAFGVPQVAEDDALRAVRAALAMQEAFRALAAEQAVGAVGLRVAVNSGEVVVSDAADDLLGDPVNVAARLQQEAGDGEVVLGAATQRLVATSVTLAALGSVALKGRTEAVAAYRLISLEPPAPASAAPFVGRDEELARLGAVYDAAVATPAARLAVLLGSPGLGKSRLIAEFARRCGGAASVLTAACDAAGGATFAPLAEALRERLGLEDGGGPEALRAAVESVLPAADGERGRIADGIARLLAGSPASPEETFFVVRRFLAGLARTQPVLLVIDDLQWAEPLLLDLVEHLAQWGAGVPLCVLVGARPELRAVRSSLVTPGGLVAEVVTLAGLDAGAAMRLAANVIGAADLPAAVAAKVLATSEGNPLFVGELVRMLVQEGALTREGERWVVGAGLAALEMPPTIHALLAARIERLGADERSVLERAAVVGRHFSRSAVAALLAGDAGDLDARLESLRRSELIEPDTGWLLGEPLLRFHHVLIRDAAYRRLLKGTRAELHARLADWIEAQVGDAPEHDETIGWHLEQAHQLRRELGPLDAGGRTLGERAARRLADAGRRALARDDLPLAASLLGRAIDRLGGDDPARADLALDWCEALLAAGDVGPAAAAVDELAHWAALEGAASPSSADGEVRAPVPQAPQKRPPRTGGDEARRQRLAAWHTCFAGQLMVLTAPQTLQDTAGAVAAAAEALAALGDAAGEAKAHQVHAQALARLGRVGACEAALDRALAAARRAGDRRRANAVLAGAPLAALWGPSPVTRASGRCLDVVRVLRITQGAPAVEAVALSCQGVLEALRGRTDAARRMIGSSRRMVEELGITHRLLEADVFAGRIEMLQGDAAAAERSLRGAYEGLRDLGLGIDAARAAALLARALLAQGRAAEAEALSRDSEALAGDDLQAAIAWRGVRAEALAQRGEHVAAVELAQVAVAIASATDALLDHADARLALAAALRAAGRGGEADAEKRRATELWDTKGATLLAERAQRDRSAGDTTPVAPTARAASRLEPPRALHRRVRANAATASTAAFDAAFASASVAAIEQAFLNAASVRVVDHPTESTYGRAGAIESYRRLLRLKDPVVRHEPLATLGESLALFRRRIAAGGSAAPGRFDVAAFDREEYVVIEPGVLIEIFAADRLGDAIARLYGRYAELLPEGPEREHAAVAARAIAYSVTDATAPSDLSQLFHPRYEDIDHRNVGYGTLGIEEARQLVASQRGLADDLRVRIEDILALHPDGLVRKTTTSGVWRNGGGAFERTVCILSTFGADGRATRQETFDSDREVEALARFDVLTGTPAPRSPGRRVLPNAATAVMAQMEAAFAARDLDAVAALLGEAMESVDHQTGSVYGREGHLDSSRRMMRLPDLVFRLQVLATLGDRLCLLRRLVSASGTAGGHFDVAEYEMEHVGVLELDAVGRCRSFETFAADHLADAVGRLYQRAADALPAGPARTRAATAARSIERMFLGLVDRDRLANPFSPTVEWVDHRVAGVGTLRGDAAVLAAVGAFLDLTVDGRWRLDEVLACSAEGLLTRATNVGTDRDGGGAFERTIHALIVFDADGCVGRWETFDLDREAEALARFDEVAAPRPPVGRRVRENMATALGVRFDQVVAARDADALSDLLSERFEFVHHPTAATYGRRGLLTTWRSMFRAARLARRAESLATLGDSLLLGRHVINAEGFAEDHLNAVGPIELEEIGLWEVDARGRALHMEVFAPNRLADGVARLYARYAASLPDGPARDRALMTARFFAALAGPPDLDACAATVSPAVEMVDRRILGDGLRGADAGRELYRALFELESFTLRFDDVLQAQPDATLFRTTTVGPARDGGGAHERPVLHLCVFGVDGLLARHEVFDSDREAEALARFDELVGGRPPAAANRLAANAATPFRERIDAAWHARDWQGLAALLASDYRFSDRRRLVQVDLDRDGWVEMARRLGGMRSARAETDVLATRGNRLALWRVSIDVADGDVGPSHVEHLNLHEVNAAGDRLVSGVRFDADDLDAAYAEIDARYAADPDVPQARVAMAVVRGIAQRDWEALAGLCSPTFVQHDHRRLAVLGTTRGGEAWARNVRALVELAPDSTYRAAHVRCAPRGAVVVGSFQGTRDRGSFEIPHLVVEVDGSGALARVDVYEPDQLAQALARFDALREAAAAPEPLANTAAPQRFANAATATVNPVLACMGAHDWPGFARLFADDFHMSDRRRVVQLELDRDQYVAFTREVADGRAVRGDSELLATRGERLALGRSTFEFADADVGPSEIAFLILTEVNDRGRIVAYVRWDVDDLDAAYAELDARWEAGEATARPLPAKWLADYLRSFAARDWRAMTALFAPDLVGENHRLVGRGTRHGPAGVVSILQALIESAPDARQRVDHLRTCRNAVLVEYAWYGTREGSAFENLWLVLIELDASGRACRADVWEAEQLESAQAHFAEVAARAMSPRPAPSANAATRAVDHGTAALAAPDPLAAIATGNAATAAVDRWRLSEAGNGPDWDALRASCAPGLVFEDRQGFARLAGDREMMIASLRERAASGARPERRLLGTAGERIAIVRMLWSGGPAEGRFEIEYISVTEVDESGLLTACILFGADAARAAQREAWARWAAIDPTVAAMTTALGETIDSWNAGDSERLRAAFAEDLVVEDHRLTGTGRSDGREAYMRSVIALWELAPEARLDAGWHWLAIAPHAGVYTARRSGTLPDGGPFESDFLTVATVKGGRTTRVEIFEIGAADAALARFAELRPDPLRIPPNAASRTVDRQWALARAGEWDAVEALHAPSLVFDDRRQGLRTTTDGAAYLTGLRWGTEDPRVQVARTLVATAGDRLALWHNRFTRLREVLLFEIETLALNEIDAEGRLLAVVLFDPADRAAASAELFDRYVASGADGAPPTSLDLVRAWNAHDLERVRALLPDDFYLDDRRRTGVGRLDGADAYLASLDALWNLSRDLRIETLYFDCIAPHARLYVTRWAGTNSEGGEFDAVYVCLGLARGDRPAGLEIFELEDLGAARARFAALRPDPPHIAP